MSKLYGLRVMPRLTPVAITSGTLAGSCVRLALRHEMEQLLDTLADLRDPGVRAHFERQFWMCAQIWTCLVTGKELPCDSISASSVPSVLPKRCRSRTR